MGTRGIRFGTWGIKVGMRGIRVGMWGIKLGMRGIRVGMGLGMLGMWEMRGILLLLFIYFSLALQMVHKIINYNMTN